MELQQANTMKQSKSAKYQATPLWSGPSVLTAIRTGKVAPSFSLLDTTYKDTSAIIKQSREEPIRLGRLGFQGDEQAFFVHCGPSLSDLQYNPSHYDVWRDELSNLSVNGTVQRDVFSQGGFGENVTVKNLGCTPAMDERTMCIGDLVGLGRVDPVGSIQQVKVRVTGPRMPCYKLNHRFGVPDMSQRAQDRFWTGWFYRVDTEGDVKVGDEVTLLERPFPDWPVARVQYYLFKEPKNIPVIEEILATIGKQLVDDVRKTFEKRLIKDTEDMVMRLQGKANEDFAQYRLRDRYQETDRISTFVFERVEKVSEDSSDFMLAESGSHVRLRFNLHDQENTQRVRPYSIISGDTNTFQLGIALADNSRGGSSFLHQNLQIGDVLEASSKLANTFPLQETGEVDDHVFIAGGVGITAFLGHVKHCLSRRSRFHLHYMIRNRSDYAFKGLIESLVADDPKSSLRTTDDHSEEIGTNINGKSSRPTTHNDLAKISIYVSSDGRRCNIKQVLAKHAKDVKTHIYVCGSEKLSDTVKKDAVSFGVSDSRLHFEQFSIDASGDPFIAQLERSKRNVKVSSQQSLLDALREAGIDMPSSCEAGNCGTCKVRVKHGRILHKGTGLPDGEKAGSGEGEAGEMLSCVSRAVEVVCLDM